MNHSQVRLAGVGDSAARQPNGLLLALAAIAAIVASIGDFLMLSAAHGHTIPGTGGHSTWLWLGGALGVLAIPAYFFGYRESAFLLAPSHPWGKRIAIVGGGFVAAFGAITHGLTAADIQSALNEGRGIRPPQEAFAVSLSPLFIGGSIAVIATIVVSVAFCWAAFQEGHSQVRKAALLNPIVGTLTLGLIGTLSGGIGDYLIPAAPNLAHCAFFLACSRGLGPLVRSHISARTS